MALARVGDLPSLPTMMKVAESGAPRVPSVVGMLKQVLKNGGGENRTRVPWSFSAGIYVCSLLMLKGRRLAASPLVFAFARPSKRGQASASQL